MPLAMVLKKVDARLRQWRVEVSCVLGTAAVLAALFVAAVADTALRLSRGGRFVAAAVWWGVALGAFLRALRDVWRRLPPEAVAAAIEQGFPELDNRLINYVQFSLRTHPTPWETFYLREGPPAVPLAEVSRLKNRRAHRIAYACLATALALLLLPVPWRGEAWIQAVLRVLIPWSPRAPVTLAVIESVEPGEARVVQGMPVTLQCHARGRRDLPVQIDLWPTEEPRRSVRLGHLTGRGREEFAFSVPHVVTEFRYRFAAGDAVSAWYQIQIRPPLAFTRAAVRVDPPSYTHLPSQSFDALQEETVLIEGSRVTAQAACNMSLASLVVSNETETMSFRRCSQETATGGDLWDVVWTAQRPSRIVWLAQDLEGYAASLTLPCRFLADRSPEIRVLAPAERTVLAPGAVPRIHWEASDDYALERVTLEQIVSVGVNGTSVVTVAEWPGETRRQLSAVWVGASEHVPVRGSVTFRLVAQDARATGPPHRTESPWIVFVGAAPQDLLDEMRHTMTESLVTLERLVALQRRTRDATVALDRALPAVVPAEWEETARSQAEVRRLAGSLLGDPRQPLGSLAETMRRLYDGDMLLAVEALRGVPAGPMEERSRRSKQALAAQDRILAALARVESSAGRVRHHQQIAGLVALLDALIRGQAQTLEKTRACVTAGAPPEAGLIARQDALADDAGEFLRVCRRESQALRPVDASFADLVGRVADLCEQRQVPAEMTRAAERLDAQAPADAVPCQERALAALREGSRMLGHWQAEQAAEKLQTLQHTVADARERLDKLQVLQQKVVETLRALQEPKDLSQKAYDELLEEVETLKANIREAALELARDLHIFPELPVGNDLVEDIYQVFEETAQVPGSEETPAEELGLQKEDFILQMLEKAEGRLDDMEMWLAATPDAVRRNTENFDQAELPQIPVVPLPSELEDILGELLKQQEEARNRADDSATNQGTADFPAGWDIAEGEYVNYSAKGKSGNEPPDHKEQDGRSLVGRQGMSDGETVAGSGKVNEGDERIEARRTQDPAQSGQVQEEGHVEAKATGGGKSSGYAEESGMPGRGPRRDAPLPGSELGFQAQLRRQAEALYAQASLLHVRVGPLADAVDAMRRAEEAQAAGHIRQLQEYQDRAIVALKRAHMEWRSGWATETLPAARATWVPEEAVAGMPDEAPPAYRELVAEYFKSLSRAP